MPQLPDPFKTLPDWSLNSAHYPAVFLIDKSWADTNDYAIQAGSETTDSLTESYPLAAPLVGQPTPHGETTQYIIQYMAPGLPNEKITLISVERKRDDSMRYKLSPRNLPEALVSIRAQLNPGDLVVINVGFNGAGDSFARDPLVASYLNEITDIFHSIVVMAAGNDEALLSHTLAPNAVVVGGVD